MRTEITELRDEIRRRGRRAADDTRKMDGDGKRQLSSMSAVEKLKILIRSGECSSEFVKSTRNGQEILWSRH